MTKILLLLLSYKLVNNCFDIKLDDFLFNIKYSYYIIYDGSNEILACQNENNAIKHRIFNYLKDIIDVSKMSTESMEYFSTLVSYCNLYSYIVICENNIISKIKVVNFNTNKDL